MPSTLACVSIVSLVRWMKKSMAKKQVATTSDIAPALADNRASRLALIEWVNYARIQSELGNTGETISALAEVAAIAQVVNATSQLTEDLLSGLKNYADTIESQLDRTIQERDELQNDMEHTVIDMAMQIAQVERERLLNDENAVEDAMIESMAERMINDGTPDIVAEDERRATEYRIRRAQQLAQQSQMD